MITLHRGSFRIEASGVPEPGGACFVTAEVYEGRRMVRGYYRRVEMDDTDVRQAEWNVAEDVAQMTGEAE
jgi:hypothetical protein